MTSTVFVNGSTLSDSDWFNDTDRVVYTIFNDPPAAGPIVISVGGTERLRYTAGGFTKMSSDGTYYGAATTSYHELRSATAGTHSVYVSHSHASNPSGVLITYTGSAPNDTGHPFWSCIDTGATRAEMLSNGGLSNFSANDVNLSDALAKDLKGPSDDHTAFVKALNYQKTAYKDTTEAGQEFDSVTAQDIELLDPSLVTEFAPGLKGVYEYRKQERINSVVVRLIARVEALEAK